MPVEKAYDRERIKAELQVLAQQIARIESGENIGGEDINALHERYEELQSELDQSDLSEAA